MNNDPRYTAVGQALPSELPPITSIEALRAARALVRHFGRQKDASASVTWNNMRQPGISRRCWLSQKPTAGSNHLKGWGRLIHDISHMVFSYRHPTFRSHDGGHAALEAEISEYVVTKGWLSGRMARQKNVSRAERADQRRATLIERIARWESKERRARNAVKRLRARLRATDRRRATPEPEMQSTIAA